ncbi:MAG: response regulator [Gemmatimonadales bacterium]
MTHHHFSRRTTVLVVDDNPMSLEFAAATLRKEGVSVLVARDGFQGISLLCSRGHDLALLIVDTEMPGVHGWEVIRFARTRVPAIRILRVGRPSDEAPGAEYQALQKVPVLQRPFTPADLLARVRRQLPALRKSRVDAL